MRDRLGDRREVTFFGLAPGSYAFEVRGRDITILTQPREVGPTAPETASDPVERWFRDNAAAESVQDDRPRKNQ